LKARGTAGENVQPHSGGFAMNKPILMLTLCFAAVAAAPAALAATAEEANKAALLEDGHSLAVKQCSGCHAVEATGRSPRYGAPEFRHILSRYHAETLRVELVEGIKVGHRNMPRFMFNPAGVDALIVYLHSIQIPEHATPAH
jgi:cytochrome c